VDSSLEHFGIARALPEDGDWRDTGKAQLGVFDPSAGLWELDPNRNGFWDGCPVDSCLVFWGVDFEGLMSAASFPRTRESRQNNRRPLLDLLGCPPEPVLSEVEGRA